MKEGEKERVLEMISFEQDFFNKGYSVIAGIDEAGRGPLAGDVFAGAVILPKGLIIEGINDSKKLSEKKRELLFDVITSNAISWGVGRASAEEIDEYNILNATYLAMKRAVDALSVKPEFLLVDGNRFYKSEIPFECVVKGDSKSISISAASILAKVSRDREIVALSEKYPEYNFAKHKGYGTAEHIKALKEYGPCEIHRKTFIGKILEK